MSGDVIGGAGVGWPGRGMSPRAAGLGAARWVGGCWPLPEQHTWLVLTWFLPLQLFISTQLENRFHAVAHQEWTVNKKRT